PPRQPDGRYSRSRPQVGNFSEHTWGSFLSLVKLTMWTHDPVHLNKLRRGGIARAHWLPRFHVLTVNGTSFNLAELDQRTTCLHEDDHLPEHAGETVTERALRHAHERGGYSVRATELMGDQ
ncbi:hypothetical protein ACIGKQ_25105, partial [Gordonia sp. NPDC062954]|uniref:hypothetical protein n=1 Tax=Gordonia sp. NPDC062954 TaxID=3364003 RepID=UPI0037C8284F